MKMLMRGEIKKLIKDSHFWDYFPEYETIRVKIGGKKLGCCNLPVEVYTEIIRLVMQDTAKWKKFLNEDKLVIFRDGRQINL